MSDVVVYVNKFDIHDKFECKVFHRITVHASSDNQKGEKRIKKVVCISKKRERR